MKNNVQVYPKVDDGKWLNLKKKNQTLPASQEPMSQFKAEFGTYMPTCTRILVEWNKGRRKK